MIIAAIYSFQEYNNNVLPRLTYIEDSIIEMINEYNKLDQDYKYYKLDSDYVNYSKAKVKSSSVDISTLNECLAKVRELKDSEWSYKNISPALYVGAVVFSTLYFSWISPNSLVGGILGFNVGYLAGFVLSVFSQVFIEIDMNNKISQIGVQLKDSANIEAIPPKNQSAVWFLYRFGSLLELSLVPALVCIAFGFQPLSFFSMRNL